MNCIYNIFNIAREQEYGNSASTYTDNAIYAYTFNVTGRHCALEDYIAIRQSKLLPSNVMIDYIQCIVNKLG